MLKAILYSALLVGCVTAAGGPRQATTSTSVVHRLFLEDQKDREGPAASLAWDKIAPRDQARREKVHGLLAAGDLTSAEDFHDAAYIYQHGQDPKDYLMAHLLAMMAVQKGDKSSLWISAATLDRYLRAVQQPQIFGTQYGSVNNGPYTQEPYDQVLIPDALRLAFCVPELEQQRKNVVEFNAGKYPEEKLVPPGCSR